MTLFNMMKRSKPRSTPGRTKSSYGSSSDFKPKATNVKQNLDKYLILAREAITTGDRIAAEGYYQHAEHYLRLINDFKAQQPVVEVARVSSDKGESTEEEMRPETSFEDTSSDATEFSEVTLESTAA